MAKSVGNLNRASDDLKDLVFEKQFGVVAIHWGGQRFRLQKPVDPMLSEGLHKIERQIPIVVKFVFIRVHSCKFVVKRTAQMTV
jgi:hypothetical protein